MKRRSRLRTTRNELVAETRLLDAELSPRHSEGRQDQGREMVINKCFITLGSLTPSLELSRPYFM